MEAVAFGLEATRATLEVLGASVRLRLSPAGEPFVTDGGNRILDCNFGPIADPARLEDRIRRVVGVVESGLFIIAQMSSLLRTRAVFTVWRARATGLVGGTR